MRDGCITVVSSLCKIISPTSFVYLIVDHEQDGSLFRTTERNDEVL